MLMVGIIGTNIYIPHSKYTILIFGWYLNYLDSQIFNFVYPLVVNMINKNRWSILNIFFIFLIYITSDISKIVSI